MSETARKRGRPRKAAQTIDEALNLVYSGTAPTRPRNAVEAQVMRKRRGRTRNPNSRQNQAAQYADYLMASDGCSQREACKKAAETYNLHPETVRRALRDSKKGTMITVEKEPPGSVWAGLLGGNTGQSMRVSVPVCKLLSEDELPPERLNSDS